MKSTETIYNLLKQSFWTKRKCSLCHSFFTSSDYLNRNYRLSFTQLLKAFNNQLEVMVQLTHQKCLLATNLNYHSQIVYAKKK